MASVRRRALLALCLLTGALLLTVPARAATPHDPILFVHGFSGSGSNWSTMISRFRADGWTAAELNTISYSSLQSNETIARQVRDRVNQILAATGNAKVDLVTHSMGGLSSRWYVKFLGGDTRVDDWVSLGGPNHGTTTAGACSLLVACREMLPGSSFLQQLNAGDETPGAVHYGTFWSPCDEIIIPQTSTILSGAQNTMTGCVGHISLLADASVYQQVREFVR
nr:lipolytic protein [uncultured bacterium]